VGLLPLLADEPDPALRWDVATSDVLAPGYPEDVP
jgi:hypothetical protein